MNKKKGLKKLQFTAEGIPVLDVQVKAFTLE